MSLAGELWPFLTLGATVTVIDDETRLSPEDLRSRLRGAGVTAAFLPTPVAERFMEMGWQDQSPLRIIFAAGDKLHRYPPPDLPFVVINGYGPTETTIGASFYRMQAGTEPCRYPPIGGPLANTSLWVLDRYRQPVPVGAAGELYVGGRGLARGYLRQPELTAERFPRFPVAGGSPRRLYRTGDAVRVLPDGDLEYLGRMDQQVQLHGVRIETGEIEGALRAMEGVTDAVVQLRQDHRDRPRLVAWICQGSTLRSAQQLRRDLALTLPPAMIPAFILSMHTFPVTRHGKTDRRALPDPDWLNERDDRDYEAPATATERQLACLWQEILQVEKVSRHDQFFELGGDSLLCATLAKSLENTFGVSLPVSRIFAHPALNDMAQVLDRLIRDGGSTSLYRFDFATEEQLDGSIRKPDEEAGDTFQTILLTGATGFIGAHLVAELLRRTTATIVCLGRFDDGQDRQRLRGAMERQGAAAETAEFDRRVASVWGDLSQPRFGMTDHEFRRLGGSIDAIYHSGAEVNFIKPYSLLRDANVGGCEEILRLACTGPGKPVFHLSSGAAFSFRQHLQPGKAFTEEDDLQDSGPCIPYDIGYIQSKWVAEQKIRIARERGLSVTVFRPGFTLCQSGSGTAPTGTFWAHMVRDCLRLGCYPELAGQDEAFITVDYAARALVQISLDPDHRGGNYHLGPAGAARVTTDDFFRMLTGMGYRLERVPYENWLEAIITRLQHLPDSGLYLMQSLLREKVREGKTLLQLYQHTPAFDTTRTERALAGTGIRPEPIDEDLVMRWLKAFQAEGFLPLPEAVTAGESASERSLT